MSETVTLTLKASEYDAAFGVVSKFNGPISRYVGEKIVTLIRSEVLNNKKTEDSIPDSISIVLNRTWFEGIFQGFVELLNKPETNSVDVAGIIAIGKLFKVGNRVLKFVDDKLTTLSEITEINLLDDELLDGELDGE